MILTSSTNFETFSRKMRAVFLTVHHTPKSLRSRKCCTRLGWRTTGKGSPSFQVFSLWGLSQHLTLLANWVKLSPWATPQKPKELSVEDVLLPESRDKDTLICERSKFWSGQEPILLDRIWAERWLKRLVVDWGTDPSSDTLRDSFSPLAEPVFSILWPSAAIRCCIWWYSPLCGVMPFPCPT